MAKDHVVDGFVGMRRKPGNAAAETGHVGAHNHPSRPDGIDDSTIEDRNAIEKPVGYSFQPPARGSGPSAPSV